MAKIDYIIVGQGLAGTLLAHDLLDANQKILIISKDHPAMASKVAAGLFNPVSIKRCIRSWNADLFLPFAVKRYRELEEKMSASFLNEKPIYRLFANNDNRTQWEVKYSNEDMSDYISGFGPSNTNSYLQDRFGGATIKRSGNLLVQKFLSCSKDFFQSNDILLSEEFDFNSLDAEQASYKGFQAKKIIFCEGFRVINNPLFNWLPLTPTKGEVLTIRIPEKEQMDKIISKGVYIIPLGDFLYIVGSTFHRNDWDDVVTEEGVNYLKDKLDGILDTEYFIINAKAGVRPTTKDRKPMLGAHPKHSKMTLFNGLGTRGVIQGPYLSTNFAHFLTKGTKITKHTDIQRFISSYSG